MASTELTTLLASFPQPSSMNFTFSRSWGPESRGFFAPLIEGKWGEAGKQAGWQTLEVLAGSSLEAAVQAGYKASVNKRNAVIFQDLPFRDIALTWVLRPRSITKARQYFYAIDALKAISAPKLEASNAIWDVSECIFSLKLDPSGQGNVIFESQEMVITSINVDYTPNGLWSQHKDGYPTQINLSINFLETQLAWNQGNALKNPKGQKVI